MVAKYQVYKDVAGKFRFRLKAENNKIVVVSEAYEQHEGCLNGVKSIQKNCTVQIEDLTVEGKRIPNPKYQVFTDAESKFRFHLTASNGEIIGASESYETKEAALNGVHAVQDSCNAEIEDLVFPKAPVETEAAVPAAVEAEAMAQPPPPVPVAVEAEAVAQPPTPAPAPTPPSPSCALAETKIELDKLPESAARGEMVYFLGKLSRCDTGEGIPNARISACEHDRSFMLDEILDHAYTKQDGSFDIGWKARHVDWWDDTGEFYVKFDGEKGAKASKSAIQTMVIK